MISKFQEFNETKKAVKKATKKAAKKTISDYMLKRVDEVPSSIKAYADMMYNTVETAFDKWFFRKSLANYSDEITYMWDDIKKDISEEDFKDFPIEDLCVDLRFKVVKENRVHSAKDKLNYIETGLFKQIGDDMIDFDILSFKQPSVSGLVIESYFIRFDFEITVPKDLISIDVEEFKQRIKSVVYHETAHAYDNIKNGKISTARSHLIDSANMKCLAMASSAVHDLMYFAYISSPEEIYANTVGSYGYNTFANYKNHWIYHVIQKLKAFNAKEWIDELTGELPEDAEWESDDFGATRFYKLPEDFPKLFADYHDSMLETISSYNLQRKDYHHDRYSKMRDLSLEQFAKYWEEEFNTAGELYEENIMHIINSKKKK